MDDSGDRGIALLHELSVVLARLTRVPVPGAPPGAGEDVDPVGLLWAYPVVGTLIGAAGALAYGLASAAGLSPLLAATVAVAALLALCGARPENSLVRWVERVATREPAEGVSPGGPLGTVGIATLVLTLAVRVGALAALAEPSVVAAVLVAAGALSQAVAAATRHCAPQFENPRDDETASDEDSADGTPPPRPGAGPTLAAVLIAVLAAWLVLPFATFGAVVAAAAVGGAVAALATRGDATPGPDLLRAAQHAAEIAVLVVVAAVGGDAGAL